MILTTAMLIMAAQGAPAEEFRRPRTTPTPRAEAQDPAQERRRLRRPQRGQDSPQSQGRKCQDCGKPLPPPPGARARAQKAQDGAGAGPPDRAQGRRPGLRRGQDTPQKGQDRVRPGQDRPQRGQDQARRPQRGQRGADSARPGQDRARGGGQDRVRPGAQDRVRGGGQDRVRPGQGRPQRGQDGVKPKRGQDGPRRPGADREPSCRHCGEQLQRPIRGRRGADSARPDATQRRQLRQRALQDRQQRQDRRSDRAPEKKGGADGVD